MARSSKSRIFFSGQTILNQNSYNLKVKWNDGHPEIMELIFNEKLVPSNVLDEPNSKVLITLSSSTEYFEKEIGNIKDINLPEPEEYSYKFSNWTKFKLSILVILTNDFLIYIFFPITAPIGYPLPNDLPKIAISGITL